MNACFGGEFFSIFVREKEVFLSYLIYTKIRSICSAGQKNTPNILVHQSIYIYPGFLSPFFRSPVEQKCPSDILTDLFPELPSFFH